MIREILIIIYLITFWTIFTICKVFPLKTKTTFITEFGDNVLYTLEALEEQTDQKCIIIHSSTCKYELAKPPKREVICYKSFKPLQWIKAIYHIATSKTIFVDTYFAFLSVSKFKRDVSCIQLWHAVGAMKKFGLEDHSVKNRSIIAQKRFKEVYKRFDFVVVGSEKMKLIFQRAFGIEKKQILRTGVPRTDFFFDEVEKDSVIRKLYKEIPFDRSKKVILYAPTYRDNQLKVNDLALDINLLYQELKNDYILFLSLHPAVRATLSHDFQDFVFDVSNYHINHISIVCDILISDYSSIPFEFAILHKPIIFFPYDLKEYENSRGLWDKYEHLVPGPIANNTNDIIEIIKMKEFDMDKIAHFGNQWNEYSKGKSSQKLIKKIYKLNN